MSTIYHLPSSLPRKYFFIALFFFFVVTDKTDFLSSWRHAVQIYWTGLLGLIVKLIWNRRAILSHWFILIVCSEGCEIGEDERHWFIHTQREWCGKWQRISEILICFHWIVGKFTASLTYSVIKSYYIYYCSTLQVLPGFKSKLVCFYLLLSQLFNFCWSTSLRQ